MDEQRANCYEGKMLPGKGRKEKSHILEDNEKSIHKQKFSQLYTSLNLDLQSSTV